MATQPKTSTDQLAQELAQLGQPANSSSSSNVPNFSALATGAAGSGATVQVLVRGPNGTVTTANVPAGLPSDPYSTTNVDQSFQTWSSPALSPASWGMSQADSNMLVYTGDTSTSQVQQTKLPALIGQIAMRLGIQHKKGVSTEEQIISKLGQQFGIDLDSGGPKNAKQGSEQKLLGAIVNHITGKSLDPTAQPKPTKLTDPQAWGQIADALHIQPQSTTTSSNPQYQSWTDVATAILNQVGNSSQAISQLQAQLLAAGFYGPNQMDDPSKIKEGNLDPPTILAIGSMLQQTAQEDAKGAKLTWQDLLGKMASLNPSYQQGDPLSSLVPSTSVSGAPKDVVLATQGQLAPSLRSAFEADLGSAPTPAELAQFTAEYQGLESDKANQQVQAAQQRANNSGVVYLDQNNVPMIAGVPSATEAAADFAIQTQPTAYLGHQMGNVAALILNTASQNGQGGRLLGEDPNVTTAARPL